jgi:amino-acid N-acetyltransferase
MTEKAVAAPAVRPASAADLPAVEDLLTRSELPLEGVRESFGSFVVADGDGRIVGVAGVERCGDYGLLRSAAVEPQWQGRGVGRAMIERLIADAESQGLRALYLLTTTAANYFPAFGFQEITRDRVPAEVQGNSQFTDLCPSTATVMSRSL